MVERLLALLRCPECGDALKHVADLLVCASGEHRFPVVGGVPRMLPNAFDARTRESFGREWDLHERGGRTWGMDVDERVRVFFLEPLELSPGDVRGKVVLDAGCGSGTQSVAYTVLGMDVIAVDISESVVQGHAYRHEHAGAHPDRVQFVQADLRRPPVARAAVDVIHSVGVLHHTPDPRQTVRVLRPLLRDGGVFYAWLYRREPYVTRVIDGIRAVTTRLPPRVFATVAAVMARPFLAFRAVTTALGIRGYPPATAREAAFALIDTFGSPHRHHHSFGEVAGWLREEGFASVRRCNEGRRGFGVCARLPSSAAADQVLHEPVARQDRDALQCAGLLEEVSRSRDHDEL